jgi:hypothetical protein
MGKLKRDAGYVFSDGREVGSTLQCVHCHRHWHSKLGLPADPDRPKVWRGYCMNCNGPICGPGCIECVPREKKLEIIEGTASLTAVSVPVKLWLPK